MIHQKITKHTKNITQKHTCTLIPVNKTYYVNINGKEIEKIISITQDNFIMKILKECFIKIIINYRVMVINSFSVVT